MGFFDSVGKSVILRPPSALREGDRGRPAGNWPFGPYTVHLMVGHPSKEDEIVEYPVAGLDRPHDTEDEIYQVSGCRHDQVAPVNARKIVIFHKIHDGPCHQPRIQQAHRDLGKERLKGMILYKPAFITVHIIIDNGTEENLVRG